VEDERSEPEDVGDSDAVPVLRRARASLAEERSRRISDTENMLASGLTARQVRRKVAEKYDLTPNAARRYVRAVHMVWDGESKRAGDAETRANKRAHIEAMLMAAIEGGMKRRGLVVDKHGDEHWFDNPDTRGVVAACETLARLLGIIEPETKETGTQIPAQLIVVLQQHYGIEPPKLEAVEMQVIEAEGESDG
jgi:hypothetical protein